MPPSALNLLLDFAVAGGMPLCADNEAGLDFQKLLEDQRKALAGWFLQSEHFDEVIVHQ